MMRSLTPPHHRLLHLGRVLLLSTVFLSGLGARASAQEMFASALLTFTASDGRSIEGELLGFRDDRLRVRRKDTGREVALMLSQLTAANQTELRELMLKRPDLRDVLPAAAIQVQLSRAKLRPRRGSEFMSSGSSTEMEAWAYSVTVGNRTPHVIPKLRIDYVLIGESDRPRGTPREWKEKPIRAKGSLTLENLESGAFLTEKTVPLICVTHLEYRTTYQNGVMSTDYNKVVRRTRMITLKGVWLRIYDGEDLMLELTSPENLPKDDWNAPDTNTYRDDIRFREFFPDSLPVKPR